MTYVQVAGFMQQQENIIIINYIISLMSVLLFKCVRITFHLWIFKVFFFFFVILLFILLLSVLVFFRLIILILYISLIYEGLINNFNLDYGSI
jgi:hypothetical protein